MEIALGKKTAMYGNMPAETVSESQSVLQIARPVQQSRHIAVYWDFENIHIECSRALGLVPAKNAIQPHAVDVESLMRYCKSLGIVSLCRAYADWRNLAVYTDDLLSHSIQLVQMFSHTHLGKNSTDIQMCLDILTDNNTFPHIDTVVIVTGDSDYIPLIQKLRARGIYVIGIGVVGSTGYYLPKACDEFKFYHNIAKQPPVAPAGADIAALASEPAPPAETAPSDPAPESIETSPPDSADLNSVIKLLEEAYNQAAGEQGEKITLASLKPIMVQIDPAFDPANFGYEGPGAFKKLIAAIGGYTVEGHHIWKNKEARQHKFSREILDKYKVGTVVEGPINQIMPIGMLVWLEKGITGIVNTPNISWELTPPDYRLGDKIKAKVIDINAEQQRIGLSIKHLLDNPWADLLEKYKVGDTIKGEVIDLRPANAFIRLENAITGIVHVSNISWEFVSNPSDELKVGQIIKAKIIAIEPNMRRVSLSIKHLAPDPWEHIHHKYRVGQNVRCAIISQNNYGYYVRLEKGLVGFLPDKKAREPYQAGQQIEAEITAILHDSRKIFLDPIPTLKNSLPIPDFEPGKP
ncbi:MAG: S1 RNA-binding domain-containing protein [Opitutaceae bacterium]|nr:S1 RNA-binding domain-containing protein [Opitutaceae bacterium]